MITEILTVRVFAALALSFTSLAQLDPGQGAPPWWMQYVAFGPGFIALVLILIFLIRMAPTWKEVKLRELELRSNEVNVRGEEAKALGALANVLDSVALRQREASENLEIMQRVNADASQKLTVNVAGLNDRLDRMERDGLPNLQSLTHRVESLEHNAQHSQTATTSGK